MYKYHCLNPISPVGMGQLDANYENTENAADADVILVRSAKMHEMEFGENLKAIARAGAGVNNIPLDRCAEEGIVVFNTPGANANGVKELVIAGMLLAARDIVGGINWVKGYDEDGDIAKAAEKKKKAFAGTELKGKKLGVIGLGAIGVLVANAATHLGMEVYGYDPYVSVDSAWRLSRNIHHAKTADEIYKECDYITIHVPALVDKAENVRIIGRGILDHPVRGIEVTDSKNILIDGITVVNPDHYTVFGGGSTGITIKNLKSFSCKGWSDGIDMMCCRQVLINNVFMRNSDDCIALYNHRWNWWGGSSDITVQNSILWADVAHPINIGGHGDPDSPTGEVIENLTFRNIDILEHDEDDPIYQGCMTVDCGDKNQVRNVLFEDIRVENIQEGRLFYVKVRFNEKYDKQPGSGIEGITFRNITYTGVGENPSLIQGLDKERTVQNVTFENVVINGERMKDLKGVVTNDFIKGIKIK